MRTLAVLIIALAACSSKPAPGPASSSPPPKPPVSTPDKPPETPPPTPDKPPETPPPTPDKPPTPAAVKPGDTCGDGDACPAGMTCKKYFGIAGARGPQFKTCEIPCDKAGKCPTGTTCATIADGPGRVCR